MLFEFALSTCFYRWNFWTHHDPKPYYQVSIRPLAVLLSSQDTVICYILSQSLPVWKGRSCLTLEWSPGFLMNLLCSNLWAGFCSLEIVKPLWRCQRLISLKYNSVKIISHSACSCFMILEKEHEPMSLVEKCATFMCYLSKMQQSAQLHIDANLHTLLPLPADYDLATGALRSVM